VDESLRTTLKGNVPYLAKAQFDQGEAEASTRLTHIRLVLSRTSEQEAALDKYLADLQDKASPNYHKWLTPDHFGELYGPADADIAVLVAWLESHGLETEPVSAGRTNIAFSGTVSQVEETFHISIHSFIVNGEQFYANTTDPQVPTALAAVVQGVVHLNTFRPKPQLVQGSMGKINPQTKRLERADPLPAPLPGKGPRANLTTGSASSGYFLYIVPGDAATIYDTPNSFNANNTSGTSYTGSGVKIGIGGDAIITANVVEAYRSIFLGNSTAPIIKNVDGVTSTDDSDEAYVDTELSGGLAPGAAIYFYTSTDLDSAIEAAINDNTVDIFSLSFGSCELDLSSSDNAQINSWWQQAAGQGIAVTVSSGDSGSAVCDGDTKTPATVAVGGLSVSGYASTPYNIAVGGTDLYALNNSFSMYASTSQGSSSTFYRTALNYIPESTWNDSSQTNLFINQDEPWTGANASIVAGSGGASSCSTNTTIDTTTTYKIGTCTSGYSKPSWQTGAGIPDDHVRDLPDLSLMAGNGYDSATWLVCTDDTATSSGKTVTENCTQQSDGNTYFAGIGGTSTSSPAFAGMLALVEQKTGDRLGQAAAVLYSLYNGSNAGLIFHDVTVGNNSVPCASGTPDCVADGLGFDFESGYNTGVGYDLATGLGSVDVAQLVANWSSASGSNPSFTISGPSVTFTAGAVTGNTSTISVTPANGFTGTVAFTCAVTTAPTGATSPVTCTPPSSVSVTGTTAVTTTTPLTVISTGTTTAGAYAVTVTGKSGSLTETGVVGVTVSGAVNPDATFTMSAGAASPASVSPGGTSIANVTLTAVAGYSGTVTFACAQTSGPNNASNDAPLCAFTNAAVAMGSTTPFSVETIAAVASSELKWPRTGGRGKDWTGAGGGAVLALLVFLGIPARRRGWRAMLGGLGMLVALAALGSLTACSTTGGGGGNKGDPGTAAGTYVFTVTGTGNPVVTPAPTTTFTVVVN